MNSVGATSDSLANGLNYLACATGGPCLPAPHLTVCPNPRSNGVRAYDSEFAYRLATVKWAGKHAASNQSPSVEIVNPLASVGCCANTFHLTCAVFQTTHLGNSGTCRKEDLA